MPMLKVSCFHHCYMLPSLLWFIYIFVNFSLYFNTFFLCSTCVASIPAFILLPSFDDFKPFVICLSLLWWFHLCLDPRCPALMIVSLLPYFYPWSDPYLLVWCSPFFFVVSALQDMLLFLPRCHLYCTLSVPTYMILSQLVTFIEDLSQSWFSINILSSL